MEFMVLGFGVLALAIWKFYLDSVERKLKHAVAAEEIGRSKERRGEVVSVCPICDGDLDRCLSPLRGK